MSSEESKPDTADAAAAPAAAADAAAAAPALDNATKATVQKIPLLTVKAGPRDGAQWVARLKQELNALITYVKYNKQNDNDWFLIESNKTGTRWKGKCWYVHELVKYEFDVNFEIPVSYPQTPFEIVVPELEGMTEKQYRGAKICLSAHFKPLWGKNVPHFGIAHGLALGLAPWLATEIPHLVNSGRIAKK
jgi:ufm1-conjugating enzyme 1